MLNERHHATFIMDTVAVRNDGTWVIEMTLALIPFSVESFS